MLKIRHPLLRLLSRAKSKDERKDCLCDNLCPKKQSTKKPSMLHASHYKIIALCLCIPAIAAQAFNVFWLHPEEPVDRDAWKPYPYLAKRDKRFPWGDGTKTLFHNPHKNALKDGYEDVE